jgi:hypothetical protein
VAFNANRLRHYVRFESRRIQLCFSTAEIENRGAFPAATKPSGDDPTGRWEMAKVELRVRRAFPREGDRTGARADRRDLGAVFTHRSENHRARSGRAHAIYRHRSRHPDHSSRCRLMLFKDSTCVGAMKTLTSMANVVVVVCVILEVILAEQVRLDRETPLGARHGSPIPAPSAPISTSAPSLTTSQDVP